MLQKDIDMVFALNIPIELIEDSDDNFSIDITLKFQGGHLTRPCLLKNTLNSADLQSSEVNRFQLNVFEDDESGSNTNDLGSITQFPIEMTLHL